MIRYDSKDGGFEVGGSKSQILAELCTIIRELLKTIINEKDLDLVVKLSTADDDELVRMEKEQSVKILKHISQLKELLHAQCDAEGMSEEQKTKLNELDEALSFLMRDKKKG